MASDQSMMQTTVEAAKAAIVAAREAEGSAKSTRAAQAVLRTSGPTLRQPIFDWKINDQPSKTPTYPSPLLGELTNLVTHLSTCYPTHGVMNQPSKTLHPHPLYQIW